MGMIRAEKLVFEYDKRDEEGNVIIPEVLRPYMGGKEKI